MLSPIKNVVFDVGNVLVRWAPEEIVRLTFGNDVDVQVKAKAIFGHELWLALNRGEFTEEDVKKQYQIELGLSEDELDTLFFYVKESLIPIYGSLALLRALKSQGYKVYALTDNVHEIVTFLKQRYEFWHEFDGAIVSAEVGCLKPGKEIYHHLLAQYDLNPEQTVFLDDMLPNVEGAQQVGIHGIQFLNAQQATQALNKLGVTV
ncbi:HAD family hydrolase [Vibrio sp. NTOU-M3]|uniref:HAD family hydrolase n=1 Tax=Vibrio sp. NTOU-M3 TaxID=3234954 RepID=UPI00349FC5E6